MILLGIAGAALIALAVIDVLTTTLAVSTAAGPVSARLGRVASLLTRWADTRLRRKPLLITGPVVLVATISTWIALLWAGWWAILSVDASAVVHSTTGEPASGWSRAYFAAYTLFTLGNGEFVPASDPWRIATSFATLTGLILVTMSITYLLPVVTAVTERHNQATRIASLGESAQEILANAWDGSSVDVLGDRLFDLAAAVDLTTQRHLTYPVLHFFRGRDRSSAFAVNVATLDEAVTIATVCLPVEAQPHSLAVGAWRHAVERLLVVIEGDFGQRAHEVPPMPSLSMLARRGLPLPDAPALTVGLGERERERRLLHAFVRTSGWDWSDVARAEPDAETDPRRSGPRSRPR